ncbi:ATP-binding protein [Actinoallomurus rhizosphaericola]|uniref:ATP-binding protein n=1 Tax=Actinoallomurus rhizosphaericola TaxID=2952536 RepID=UPI0020935519|nr:LuxR C-terminal-related transcriptional regulator [Actinoallomurus rhizosphaericola]MCO5996048.1 LuxR C-terminal-related transcriptional regulator [Actinoallomurus rhizosphaericola]
MKAVQSDQVEPRPHGPPLPAEVTSFVGRRHEVAEVKRLLSVSRLVTLSGVGGVGKTRLATRVSTLVHRAFPDGVWLIDLASLANPGLLVPAVCETLQVEGASAGPPLQVLIDHICDAHALLILDNCEHLLAEAALLAETLLRACPRLRILATSRQALGVAGEQTLSIPSLPVTGRNVTGPDTAPDGGMVAGDAVRLFAERAEAVVPGFTLTEDNLPTVERICHRLDALPLAIELAAVRLRALSVHQLLARLDDRFRLLTSGSRAVLPRHQTLRALIDWSYGLCTEPERLLWERTSVFSGGLDLEAAETVCAGDGIDRDDILELVIGLVDKSILLREEHSGTVRYRLLETIRQYGQERLNASGTTTRVQRRHRDHYRNLITRAEHDWFGPDQVTWLDLLRTEHPNLRAALEYSFSAADESAVGLEMAAGLLHHWMVNYYLTEGRDWLDRGLAAGTEPGAVRAKALCADAWMAITQGDSGAALRMLDEAGSIGDRLGSRSVGAYVALFRGMVAMYAADADSAIRYYKEAAAAHRRLGDREGLALGLIWLCLTCSFQGSSKPALEYGQEGLTLCDAAGERWYQAYATMALGVETWREGDLRGAAELVRRSLRSHRELDDPLGMGVDFEILAWVATAEKDYERAARLLGILRTTWRLIGAPPSGYGHLVRCHEECASRTRVAMGGHAFTMACEAGAALAFDNALAYALGERRLTAADPVGSPLTRRETEIADLVAEGMSNRDIAARLVIAQRTAEGHVEHILNKLGFNSRAQIGAWVGKRRPR